MQDSASLPELARLVKIHSENESAITHPDPLEIADLVLTRPDDRAALEPTEDSRNIVSQMASFRSSPVSFALEAARYLTGSGWRSYDNIIGQPIFYQGFSEEVRNDVMSSALLRGRITELVEKTIERERELDLLPKRDNESLNCSHTHRRRRQVARNLEEVAEQMIDQMICKMDSKKFIRGAYYLTAQLLTRAYHQGIHVSSEDIVRIRRTAQEASESKTPILFLPSHRSHIDYVSLQIICYRLGLALPTVVAGDNLNIAVLGPFLQRAGAMWIRRSFGSDRLYTGVVQAYIDTLLSRGHNMECFIEGGRSRTGKLLSPKFGILSYVLDSVMSGRVKDVLVCPVSTQYDKVVEVDAYVSELLGQPKRQESVADLLSASSVLSLKLGRVDVRFHKPWSLSEFINQQQTRLASSALNPTQLVSKMLRTLGYRVLSEINGVSVVMPTALIGTAMLTVRKRGIGEAELVKRVDWLVQRVRARGGRVVHFGDLPTVDVVKRALEVLGPELVGKTVAGQAELEDTYYPVDRFQLSFYRNMTIHLFLLDAITCAALSTRVRLGGGPKVQQMPLAELRAYVGFLSRLFRTEFIFPTGGLEQNLNRAILQLEQDQVVEVVRTGAGSDSTDSNIEYLFLSEVERQRGRKHFDFYCALIWPFVEAAWLGAISLLAMVGIDKKHEAARPCPRPNQSTWIPLAVAVDTTRMLGKTLYHQGELSFFESVNKEILKNTYMRFVAEGILDLRTAEVAKESKKKKNKEKKSKKNKKIGPETDGEEETAGEEERKQSPAPTKERNMISVQVIRLKPGWIPDDPNAPGLSRIWALADRISMSRQPSGSAAGSLGREVPLSFLGQADLEGSRAESESEDGTGKSSKSYTTTEPLLPSNAVATDVPGDLLSRLIDKAQERLIESGIWLENLESKSSGRQGTLAKL